MKKTLDSNTIQTALTLISAEFMKECLVANECKARNAKMELERLRSAGLEDSTNAAILSKIAPSHDTFTSKLVAEIKQALPQALIVPYSDLFRVMKQYNLSVGRIKHYTKIIPEENIDQICAAAKALGHLRLNQARYIEKIRIDLDMPKSAVRLLSDYVARFPLMIGESHEIPVDSISRVVHENYDSFRITYGKIYNDEWLIAAPVEDLPKNTIIEYFSGRVEERRRIAEDPIVFKASAIGAVIVSMWGEEADSSIFDKYR